MTDLTVPKISGVDDGGRRVVPIAAAAILFGVSLSYLILGVRLNLIADGPILINAAGNAVGTDFIAFYAAAVTYWRDGAAAVYDVAGLNAMERSILGYDIGPVPWHYPPVFLLIVAPLAALPYLASLWLWLGSMMAILAAALSRLTGQAQVALVALIFPGVVQSTITGQNAILIAGLVAGGLAALRTRPVVAGLLLSVVAFKPHIAVLIPFCLIAGGHWRAAATTVAGGFILVLASIAAFGFGPWQLFVAGLPESIGYLMDGRVPLERAPTTFVAVLDLTGDQAIANAAQAISTLAALIACIIVWRHSESAIARSLVLAAAIPLATPYAFDYDLAILVVPFALLARRVIDGAAGRGEVVLLGLLWLAPIGIWLASRWSGQQIGPLALSGLVAVAIGMAMRHSVAMSEPGLAPETE